MSFIYISLKLNFQHYAILVSHDPWEIKKSICYYC